MGKDRSWRGRGPNRGSSRGAGPQRAAITLAHVEGRAGQFELVHPACVKETELDYQDGLELWKAGDPEGAQDALRYALQACRDNQWIHLALGRIALHEFRDPALARGHFGYAVELARQAIPQGFRGRLLRNRPANEAFYGAVEGLISCLRALGEKRDADSLLAWVEDLGGAEQAPPERPPEGPAEGRAEGAGGGSRSVPQKARSGTKKGPENDPAKGL
ncbi:MAG TPA: hypothetical protein VJY33_15715 [Isosphaeraceae bacterium]|nr:hypothetical protein [Isosphaeraceae bacterium]